MALLHIRRLRLRHGRRRRSRSRRRRHFAQIAGEECLRIAVAHHNALVAARLRVRLAARLAQRIERRQQHLLRQPFVLGQRQPTDALADAAPIGRVLSNGLHADRQRGGRADAGRRTRSPVEINRRRQHAVGDDRLGAARLLAGHLDRYVLQRHLLAVHVVHVVVQRRMVRQPAVVAQCHVLLLPLLVQRLAAALVQVALFDGDRPAAAQFAVLQFVLGLFGRRRNEEVRAAATLARRGRR